MFMRSGMAIRTLHPDDIEAYMDGKNPFITTHEARALAWSA